MCANACKTYLLQKQCINLVSLSSVVQAEITSSNNSCCVPFRKIPLQLLVLCGTERNQVRNQAQLHLMLK